ncbi:hypothetical protein [Fulvivirga aurantia]|uniref:hypothetical protein n=1 Tax=Fulvivirga aurantia TaxID=2529383 RepID=UPI0012BD21A2|nr:hypothetical protein [Fulvivirga aurantia]
MVCSFDLNPKSDDQPVNYRPKVFHSHFKKDMEVSLVDLYLMTSAGPTYFPIYKEKYVDGGVSLNNPSMAALAYAMNTSKSETPEYRHPDGVQKGLEQDMNNIKMLSLGCSNLTPITYQLT